MKLVNVQEMRRIEQAADAGGHSYATMMERAGEAVASSAVALTAHRGWGACPRAGRPG